jgi:hypothetical protein
MYARVAAFEGGDVERLRQVNAQEPPARPEGLRRALLLQHVGANRRLFVTFFDSREAVEAAEARFEQMGDEIPEEVRGRRTSVDTYEVVFDESA